MIASLLALSSFVANAQSPQVSVSADKQRILIGEPFTFDVKASFLPGDHILWLDVPDSMAHFALLARGRVDSSYTDGRLSGLEQRFTLTSFDSGQWAIPSFDIIASSTADTLRTLHTDSLPVAVAFLRDTTQQLRDIKPIREVAPERLFWYWVVGSALLLLLVYLVIRIIRMRREQPATSDSKPAAFAYEETMEELDKLSRLDLSDAVQVKQFHSGLGHVFRSYISYRQQANRRTQTTGELLVSVKESRIDGEVLSSLASALRCGDAVKFAKYLPPPDISKAALAAVKKSIEVLHQETVK